MTSVDEFVNSSAWLIKVSGAGRGRHAATAADAHGGRLAARAHPRPLLPLRPAAAMDLADVPRHRPLAFDKMESLIKEMQDPESGVPVRSQKLFLTFIPSAFMGYDLVEWLMERFNLDESSNVEAINLANQLCLYGYFFPVNDSKNLVLKDDSSLYRFQSPYYWPWQGPRVAGSGSCAPTLGPDNVEYAIYLVKRTLRNKQRHGLDEYEVEALANLKKNLAAKWDFITMQAEEQVRLAKDRKKGDKIVSDSQERAYWRVARPGPGQPSALEPCPVPARARRPVHKKRSTHHLTREIEHLKTSLDRTRVKTSIALEALLAYSETFAPYDPWLTPPQPSNPWVSDDTLFWQINSPLVEVPSEKRVQRWALSIEELVSDPTGLQEFTSFLRKEYSHENIRFWLAVMDLRRSSTKQIPKKLQDIYEEFLKSGAPCEINIDGATAERVAEGLRTGSRYALDHAADHVYGLLLKKDCYPRFVRSDHFQRLLTEGRNVHQKKAKFFNFGGGQVKKKPGSTSGTGAAGSGGGAALTRRRGSDRSLSGSAHELAVCAAQPPRTTDPPPHSHSQSNLCDIPFRYRLVSDLSEVLHQGEWDDPDEGPPKGPKLVGTYTAETDPLDDDSTDVLPWECSSRESGYGVGGRRRQDSTADSGSSSSDVSSAVAAAVAGVAGERTRRLPQQSTLDGGLRGAPPPLRRLSAVEPRHLAPLGSPPRARPVPAPAAAPVPPPAHAPPHPTPTISVSSAPEDESADSPHTCSPEEPRSLAHSEEPPSVFASADATPTDPLHPAGRSDEPEKTGSTTISVCDISRTDVCNVETKVKSNIESTSVAASLGEGGDAGERGPRVAAVAPEAIEDAAPAIGTSSVNTTTIEPSPASLKHMISKNEVRSESVPTTTNPLESFGGVVVCTTSGLSGVVAASSGMAPAAPVAPAPVAPVAPLAVCEDIGVDEDSVDKVPSAPLQRISGNSKTASLPDATSNIAHKDELSSVSDSHVDRRDNKLAIERKNRNDVCPWEDE